MIETHRHTHTQRDRKFVLETELRENICMVRDIDSERERQRARKRERKRETRENLSIRRVPPSSDLPQPVPEHGQAEAAQSLLVFKWLIAFCE